MPTKIDICITKIFYIFANGCFHSHTAKKEWKNHFFEMNRDVGMTDNEREGLHIYLIHTISHIYQVLGCIKASTIFAKTGR